MNTMEKLKAKGLLPESTPFDPENNPILKLGRAGLAGVESAAKGEELYKTVEAMKAQLQPQAPEAPQGEELFRYIMEQKMPKSTMALDLWKSMIGRDRAVSALPEKLGGIATELVADPSNLLPGKLAAGLAMPMVAGTVGKVAAKTPLGFYSKLEEVILEKMGKSATPEQVRAIAKGAKEEEVAVSGLEELLKGKEKVSQEEVLQQIRSQRPQLEEVIKGSETKQLTFRTVGNRLESGGGEFWIEPNTKSDKYNWTLFQKGFGPLTHATHKENLIAEAQKVANYEAKTTKFEKQVEPGGKNYREVLITLPTEKSAQKQTGRLNELYQIADRRNLTEAESVEMTALERGEFLPNQEGLFVSQHWDEPNVLAHARVNDRVDEAGNKLFHVEEIQSDWHQKGRQEGYRSEKKIAMLRAEKNALEVQIDNLRHEGLPSDDEFSRLAKQRAKDQDIPLMQARNELRQEIETLNKKAYDELNAKHAALNEELNKKVREIESASVGAPDAPFKKSWMELMAKRMVTQAVESGADRMSWTPGIKQAERYDLSKQVSQIVVPMVQSSGTRSVRIEAIDGNEFRLMVDSSGVVTGTFGAASSQFNGKKLSEVVGKEVADKIMAANPEDILTGSDLQVGGEGMKGFYDKMLPDFLRKFGKKYGAEVGETTTNGIKVPFLELTPELKKAVKEKGLPLFQIGAGAALPALIDKMRQDDDGR
jgi:hypothetical protein